MRDGRSHVALRRFQKRSRCTLEVDVVQLAFSSIFLALCPIVHELVFNCHANDSQLCGVPASRACDGVFDCDSGGDESEQMCNRKFVEIKLII